MKNLISRVKTTQLQNQSQLSDSDGENIEESFEELFAPEEDIQHVRYEGTNGGWKQGRGD